MAESGLVPDTGSGGPTDYGVAGDSDDYCQHGHSDDGKHAEVSLARTPQPAWKAEMPGLEPSSHV